MNRVRGKKKAAKRFDIVAVVSERRRPDEANSSSSPSTPTSAIGPCQCCPCYCCSSFAPAPPACRRHGTRIGLRGGCAKGRACCGLRRRDAIRVCRHCHQSLAREHDYANSAQSSFGVAQVASESGESRSDESSNTSSRRRGCDVARERTQPRQSSTEECFDCEHVISEASEVQESAADDERPRNCETRSHYNSQQRASLKNRADRNRNNKSREIHRSCRVKHKHDPNKPATSRNKTIGSQATARPSILKSGRPAEQAEADELQSCALDNGENSRCNCAGRRRPTLAALIELFEQQVRVDCPPPDASGHRSGAKATDAGRMRDILTPVKYEASSSGSSISNEDLDDSIDGNTSTMDEARRVECECLTCRAADDERQDSLDYQNCRLREQEQHRARASKSPIERVISTGGVQVLPSQSSVSKTRSTRDKEAYLRRKLTKTNWQAPTDARKYELKSYERRAASRQAGGRPVTTTSSAPSLAGHCCPALVRHQPSSSRRQLKQFARLKQLDEPAGLYKVNRQGRRQSEAGVARVEELIEQLERATVEMDEDEHLLDRAERRDLAAKYQERITGSARESQQQQSNNAAAAADSGREQKEESTVPAKRAQLIDFGWRDDVDPLEEESIARSHCVMRQTASNESTLKRPARRDWRDSPEAGSQTLRARPRPVADRYRDDLAVRRLSASASRSPSTLSGRISSPTGMDPRVSYLLCSDAYVPKIEGRTSASAYVDNLERRLRVDDLHYRAVRPTVVPEEPPFGVPRDQQAHVTCGVVGRASGPRPTATERLRSNSKTSFLEFDNCGGEQKWREATSSMQQADDEKQQQKQPQYKTMSPTRTPSYNQVYKSPDPQAARRLNESRVSFSPTTPVQEERKVAKLTPSPDARLGSRASGCASADSGIAASSNCADSPVQQLPQLTSDSRSEGKSRRREEARNLEREIQMLDNLDGGNLDEDLVLAELDRVVELHQQTTEPEPACESCTLERVQTEMRATPTRRRPRISIAEPRSKSPLLRVSQSQTKPVVEVRMKPERQTVTIQRYEDSWPRRRKSSDRGKRHSTGVEQALSSIEFQCDFDDEDEDEQEQADSYKEFMRRQQSPVITYEGGQSSSTPNETSGSSLDRLEPVDGGIAGHVSQKVAARDKLDTNQCPSKFKSCSHERQRIKPKIANKMERPIMFSIASRLLVAARRVSPAFPADESESTHQPATFDSGSNTVRRHQPTDVSDSLNTREYLASLPILSVGQKHAALFECDMSLSAGQTQEVHLLWVKLMPRGSNGSLSDAPGHDITPLAIDQRLVTNDKRYKVHHRPAHKWVLSIENVGATDDKAFYLCQASGVKTSAPNNYIGGARLNVLVPPKLVEQDTSPNLITVSEYEPLKLVCKVIGEPQAQIVWRREDGHSLDGLEQRFKHQLDRSQPQRLISIDSSELLFDAVHREQAGAYLCIASNGVQPGVSQRMSVTVVKCRTSEGPDSEPVDCAQQSTTINASERRDTTPESLTTLAPSSTTTTLPANKPQQQQSRAKWKLGSMSTSGAMGKLNSVSANHSMPSVASKRTGQRAQPQDKTRASRLHSNTDYKNDRALAIGANNRRLLAELNGESSGAPSSTCDHSIQIVLTICTITQQIAGLAAQNWARVRMLHEHH